MNEQMTDLEPLNSRLLVVGLGRTGTAAVQKLTGKIHGVECLDVTELTEKIRNDIRESCGLFLIGAEEAAETASLARELFDIMGTQSDRKIMVALCLDDAPRADDLPQLLPWPAKVTRLSVGNVSLIPLLEHDTEFMAKQGMDVLLLRLAVQACTDLITHTGFICVDFADVRYIAGRGGEGVLGIGYGTGPENGSRDAARNALCAIDRQIWYGRYCHLLSTIYASSNMTLDDFDTINRILHEYVVSDDVNIIIGVNIDDMLGQNFRVSVIAVSDAEMKE